MNRDWSVGVAGFGGVVTERQQLAEAIRQALRNGTGVRVQNEGAAVNAVVPLLVAAERAGYERCKRDATTAITKRANSYQFYDLEGYTAALRDDIAALNATQRKDAP